MPKIHLVEITSAEPGHKGTWYHVGQRHFVQQQPGWPQVYVERWHALTPSTWGGINEADCRVLRGPVAWLRCLRFRLTMRDAPWAPKPLTR
jgi:hypothetical protein